MPYMETAEPWYPIPPDELWPRRDHDPIDEDEDDGDSDAAE